MAHNFVSSGSRLTVGSQTSAGITKPQKLPYESSTFGGLSILNGPVQIGYAPLSAIPKGVLHVGMTAVTSGPDALAAIFVKHPITGIKVESDFTGIDVDANVENKIKGNEKLFYR